MLLREELGNVKVADTDKFKTTGTSWDAVNERQFCLNVITILQRYMERRVPFLS